MKWLAILICAGLALAAAPLRAADLPEDVLSAMRAADVVLLGEVHDNPDHHRIQAQALAALKPAAVVWEMLTPETAARFRAGWLDDPDNVAKVLKAAGQEWPSFDLYRVVVKAASGTAVYGGLVPRQTTMAVMDKGIAAVFGSEAARYGLMIPLAPGDQRDREAEQLAAHCDAIPVEQLPLMVSIQRLRDAVLAHAVVEATEETGGPVAVITGNGHARTDRGVPEVLARVAPGLRVFALGQSEDGAITGTFDAVIDSPAVDRPDPCAVFENRG